MAQDNETPSTPLKTFAIDGVAVPAPSLGESLDERDTVTSSYRNGVGTMIMRIVSNARKFTWNYNYIKAEDLSRILKIINDKQEQQPADYTTGTSVNNYNSFDITSWSTKDNDYITVACYPSATITPTVIYAENGIPKIYSVKINWVEIAGGYKGK